MGTSSTGKCLIRTEQTFYFGGDVIVGTVYANLTQNFPCSRVMMTISGFEKTKFTKDEAQHIGEHQIFNTTGVIFQWESIHYLKGQYTFPFQFRLPNYIPGSFKGKKADYDAEIRYQAKVILVSQNEKIKNIEQTQEIIIREKVKDHHQNLFGDLFLEPVSCYCFKKGIAKISCYLERSHYFPDETCTVICQADNFKSKVAISNIQCQFIKKIEMKSSQGISRLIQEKLNTLEFPGLAAKTSYMGEGACRKSLELKNKSTKVPIHPSTSGRLVESSYCLHIKPKYSGFCHGECQTLTIPISISQPGIEFQKIKEPSEWNPEVFAMSTIGLNGFSQNEKLNNMPTM